jgi:hypothetical protein
MRITASDIPSAIGTPEANCQPNDVVQHKIYGQPTTPAMQHGIDSEPTAAEAYKQLVAASLPADGTVQVDEMGFVVHSTLPYIGASPDRRVQISISGEAQPARYVQIKCPHSQKLDAFRSRLPDRVQVQVIAELAVLNSHPTLKADEMDVFIWAKDQQPVIHTVKWADVQDKWFIQLLPKVKGFYFRLMEPALKKLPPSVHAIPSRTQQPQQQQQQPSPPQMLLKAAVLAELRRTAAENVAAVAAAVEAEKRQEQSAHMGSPLSLVSPAMKVGKRVSHVRTTKVGTVTEIRPGTRQVFVDWDDDGGEGAGRGGELTSPETGAAKGKRKRAVDEAYLAVIPVDMESGRLIEPTAQHLGDTAIVIKGEHAGKTGTIVVKTGQNCRVDLEGKGVASLPTSSLRVKVTTEQAEAYRAQHAKVCIKFLMRAMILLISKAHNLHEHK